MTWRFSRSHVEEDNFCRYAGYLRYLWGGTGVVPSLLNMDLELGTLVHDGLARVLRARTLLALDDSVADALCAYRTRVPQISFGSYDPQGQMDLGEGLIRGWFMARFPFYKEKYTLDSAEAERERDIALGDDIALMVRSDMRVTRKVDGEVFAGPEFKTTSYLTQDYFDQWKYAAQIAAELAEGESGVLMEFLFKGRRENGKLKSPLVKDKPAGMPVKDYLVALPAGTVAGQFSGMEVYRAPSQVQRWLDTQKMRQSEIRYVVTEEGKFDVPDDSSMLATFPPRLDSQCYSNKYKKPCDFLRVCWGGTSVEAGLEHGIYVRRTPHHEQERNFEV